MPGLSVIMTIILMGAVLVGAIHAYSGRLQATTLWAGRAIAPLGSEQMMPTGLQDALTPPWQTRLQLVWLIGYPALLIVGTLQAWYFGIVALVLAFLVSGVVGAFLPCNAAWYLRVLANNLANREADYQKGGDMLRAEAARETFGRVALLLEHVAASDMRVPSQSEAKATPFGQVDDFA
jgi:hypothetical protein